MMGTGVRVLKRGMATFPKVTTYRSL